MVESRHGSVKVRFVAGVVIGCSQEAVVFTCKLVYSSGAYRILLSGRDPRMPGRGMGMMARSGLNPLSPHDAGTPVYWRAEIRGFNQL